MAAQGPNSIDNEILLATTEGDIKPTIKRRKVNIVFDVDGVIAGHEKIDSQTALYFLRNGAVIIAQKTHYIFPGIMELLRKIVQSEDVSLSFFSSGDDERNHELVEKLLIGALGETKYEDIKNSIKVCSRSDLTRGQREDCLKLYHQFNMSAGNKVKDISKALLKDSKVEDAIFIDNDPTYVKYGQQMCFLHSRSVTSEDYQTLGSDYYSECRAPEKTEIFQKVNNAFYLAAMIFRVLEKVNADQTPASEVLFPMQFKSVEGKPFKYKLKREDNWSNKELYNHGLLLLQEENPNLELCTKDSFLKSIYKPETEQESSEIENAIEHENDGCNIM